MDSSVEIEIHYAHQKGHGWSGTWPLDAVMELPEWPAVSQISPKNREIPWTGYPNVAITRVEATPLIVYVGGLVEKAREEYLVIWYIPMTPLQSWSGKNTPHYVASISSKMERRVRTYREAVDMIPGILMQLALCN